jgi:hypothetical protein
MKQSGGGRVRAKRQSYRAWEKPVRAMSVRLGVK